MYFIVILIVFYSFNGEGKLVGDILICLFTCLVVGSWSCVVGEDNGWSLICLGIYLISVIVFFSIKVRAVVVLYFS